MICFPDFLLSVITNDASYILELLSPGCGTLKCVKMRSANKFFGPVVA